MLWTPCASHWNFPLWLRLGRSPAFSHLLITIPFFQFVRRQIFWGKATDDGGRQPAGVTQFLLRYSVYSVYKNSYSSKLNSSHSTTLQYITFHSNTLPVQTSSHPKNSPFESPSKKTINQREQSKSINNQIKPTPKKSPLPNKTKQHNTKHKPCLPPNNQPPSPPPTAPALRTLSTPLPLRPRADPPSRTPLWRSSRGLRSTSQAQAWPIPITMGRATSRVADQPRRGNKRGRLLW